VRRGELRKTGEGERKGSPRDYGVSKGDLEKKKQNEGLAKRKKNRGGGDKPYPTEKTGAKITEINVWKT